MLVGVNISVQKRCQDQESKLAIMVISITLMLLQVKRICEGFCYRFGRELSENEIMRP